MSLKKKIISFAIHDSLKFVMKKHLKISHPLDEDKKEEFSKTV